MYILLFVFALVVLALIALVALAVSGLLGAFLGGAVGGVKGWRQEQELGMYRGNAWGGCLGTLLGISLAFVALALLWSYYSQ